MRGVPREWLLARRLRVRGRAARTGQPLALSWTERTATGTCTARRLWFSRGRDARNRSLGKGQTLTVSEVGASHENGDTHGPGALLEYVSEPARTGEPRTGRRALVSRKKKTSNGKSNGNTNQAKGSRERAGIMAGIERIKIQESRNTANRANARNGQTRNGNASRK